MKNDEAPMSKEGRNSKALNFEYHSLNFIRASPFAYIPELPGRHLRRPGAQSLTPL